MFALTLTGLLNMSDVGRKAKASTNEAYGALSPGPAAAQVFWVSAPGVGVNPDGRLEVFVVGSDFALWHNWQLTPGGAWSGWAPL